jgi:hypothetical protein
VTFTFLLLTSSDTKKKENAPMNDTKQEADLSAGAEILSDLIMAIKATKSRKKYNEAIQIKIDDFMEGVCTIK